METFYQTRGQRPEFQEVAVLVPTEMPSPTSGMAARAPVEAVGTGALKQGAEEGVLQGPEYSYQFMLS